MAAQRFEIAALANFAPSQFNLGNMYLLGVGVEQHSKAAIYWLEKAGNRSHIKAINKLGEIYQLGILVEKRFRTSFLLV